MLAEFMRRDLSGSRGRPAILVGLWLLVATAQAQRLHVFAAASLKESFGAIAKDFETLHPNVKVDITFAGSQQLAAQIGQGAPCDVFASADLRNLLKTSLVPGSQHVFAYNRLVMISSLQYGQIKSLETFALAPRIVVAASAVPVGAYTQRLIAAATPLLGKPWAATLTSHIVSQEQDVRAVLAKVELGEADEGIVYSTDAATAGKKICRQPIPSNLQPNIVYPVGVERQADEVGLAKQFVAFLLSPIGQKELQRRGFAGPITVSKQ
jgi:molybdate transport system substrate-binding protein